VEVGEPGETAGVDWLGLNRANWNDRVPVRLASEFYDLAGFGAGRDSLRPFKLAEAGDVRGKRLLHLQCHIGLGTLSWARHGALASGLDFSVPAIEAARSLAAELGIPASFVVSDVYSAVAALEGQRLRHRLRKDWVAGVAARHPPVGADRRRATGARRIPVAGRRAPFRADTRRRHRGRGH
jgi:hypothetical protein